MLSGRRLATTTRTGAVRLVVVLSVLVGLTVAQAAPCLDRADASGHGSASVVMLVATASIDEAEAVASQPPLDTPAGLIGLCVVVLLAVVFALARPAKLYQLVTVLAPPLVGRLARRRRRPTPALAVLCVLRA